MTLLMRDQENIEKGREEGRKEGIKNVVSVLKDLNVSDKKICEKIMDKYGLSKEDVERYL